MGWGEVGVGWGGVGVGWGWGGVRWVGWGGVGVDTQHKTWLPAISLFAVARLSSPFSTCSFGFASFCLSAKQPLFQTGDLSPAHMIFGAE